MLKRDGTRHSGHTRTRAAGLHRKGEGVLSALEISFNTVTRHSYTPPDFHLNQRLVNCLFIWLDTGQALFTEIGLHITGTILVKGNICFKKKKVLEVKRNKCYKSKYHLGPRLLDLIVFPVA